MLARVSLAEPADVDGEVEDALHQAYTDNL